MSTHRAPSDRDRPVPVVSVDRETSLLTPGEERALLERMCECKRKLEEALASIRAVDPAVMDDPVAQARTIAAMAVVPTEDGGASGRLGAIVHAYLEARDRLAMSNMKLVAHVAKRFRDRGIPHADLLQEGFCGLMEAIDRFDLGRGTKLATYATWWIRQSIQQAVAAGAYPVRLSPRHLRQLAKNQQVIGPVGRSSEHEENGDSGESSEEVVRRIHAATRPAVSFDDSVERRRRLDGLRTSGRTDVDTVAGGEIEDAIGRLIHSLRPREQEVLSHRFGLGGRPRLSLSQVGEALQISKERARQIEDRALEKLREIAGQQNLAERLALDP
ncbi:sigma-70 family RNA polymerase sigma factor [Aquisphaera insulae]|uniref:sigma-70 family RNA polymerase sigma factor n=1 Tax=Aquisphaera insulae TaxID=2712864 RepID=UPI0013EC2EDD|nr:sigma-70 family RNA polymerase sigma factor [Aquisphaera insulae]